jgi:hypothetical protein
MTVLVCQIILNLAITIPFFIYRYGVETDVDCYASTDSDYPVTSDYDNATYVSYEFSLILTLMAYLSLVTLTSNTLQLVSFKMQMSGMF